MLEVAKHPSPPGNRRPTMTEGYDGRQVVGMDLHRRRSVLVRMTEDGRKLETVRITNSPAALRAVLARAGKNPRVVVEATYGWYWAVDVLEEAGAEVHLAHPLGVKAFTSCRDQVHAVLAKLGVPVTHSDIFGVHGQAWLDGLRLPQPYAGKVASLRQLNGELSGEITL